MKTFTGSLDSPLTVVRRLLEQHKLDICLFYSDACDSRWSRWLFGISPILYHYVFVTPDSDGLVEIDYLAHADQATSAGSVILVSGENRFGEELYQHFGHLSRIGLVGLAPYNHVRFFPAHALIDVNQQLSPYLAMKAAHQVSAIAQAAQLCRDVAHSLSHEFFVGQTERQAARAITRKLLEVGERLSFSVSLGAGDKIRETTVCIPTDYVIAEHDPVVLDCGVVCGGWYTDITRMWFANSDPKRDSYRRLCQAHYRVIDELRAGIRLGEIAQRYTAYLDQTFADYRFFPADLGHSIGFGLHEEPVFVTPDNQEYVLQSNQVITLEPEIAVDGWRYRVEDMVLIKETGAVVLTNPEQGSDHTTEAQRSR